MAPGTSSLHAEADAELAARDRSLPGLEVLLDDEQLTAVLDEALPGAGLRAVQATYVRYKPQTACIVACRLTLADVQVDAYVRLERPTSHDHLAKYTRRATARSPLGHGAVLLAGLTAALYPQPNDRRIAVLPDLADDARRRNLLAHALPDHRALWSSSLQPLRWKPERRFVAALQGHDGTHALVKAYAGRSTAALRAATLLGDRTGPRTPRCLGRSSTAGFIVLEWLAGHALDGALLQDGAATLAGAALADLHASAPPPLPQITRDDELRHVQQSVDTVGWLLPHARSRAQHLAEQVERRLPPDGRRVVSHGDFSHDQVLIHHGDAALVDLDDAALCDPLRDLGSFVATLWREVVGGRLTPAAATAAQNELVAGYGPVDRGALRAWTAAALLHLAPEPFRHREPDWPAHVGDLLAIAEACHDS